VTQSGITTFVSITAPLPGGSLPTGYTVYNDSPSYDITTTASFTPPVTICFFVWATADPVVFSRVRILQGQGGDLVDRTILPPDNPGPNFDMRQVCARAELLGRFVTALSPAPTPTVIISGRVLTPGGLGVRNAVVTLTDSKGARLTATTSSFGVYSFSNIRSGDAYFIGVSSKRYRFTTRVVNVAGNLTDIDFIGLE
jgi:hypothetical protein